MFPGFVEVPKKFSVPVCASAWTEERPLPLETAMRLSAFASAMEKVAGERPDIKPTETYLCWRSGPGRKKVEGGRAVAALLNCGYTMDAAEEIKGFYLSYGPLLNKKEAPLREILRLVWSFHIIAYSILPSLHPEGFDIGVENVINPLKIAVYVHNMMGEKPKTFYPTPNKNGFNFHSGSSWPVFPTPPGEASREEIIEWLKTQAWKNAAQWLGKYARINIRAQKDSLTFHITPENLFTYVLAYSVFGSQESKTCACGCGLPALHGNYYNATHKRRCISTRPKQKAIAYFYKMLDGKNNRERHEEVKKEINRLWSAGVEDYETLIRKTKAFVRKRFGVVL
ncbi:hypothetical protein [Desulfofundulus salinus]|uniref:Uncharacterized protein n=1 Tax=Desulfofundulus salinus TaxID=2419843 RepID=A0A494WUG9_9FIRM|nr:hypothetical protein [Desulfofundulus salinum]RKO67048.1 hypothetical protein D7024_08840 [Desulfofundulus salinum]